jgi:hypothetical protein
LTAAVDEQSTKYCGRNSHLRMGEESIIGEALEVFQISADYN